MSQDRVTVEDIIDGAIIAGFQNGARAFLESLEDQIRTSELISESGSAQDLLQQMIDESEGEAVATQSTVQLVSLDEKLSRIFNRG